MVAVASVTARVVPEPRALQKKGVIEERIKTTAKEKVTVEESGFFFIYMKRVGFEVGLVVGCGRFCFICIKN